MATKWRQNGDKMAIKWRKKMAKNGEKKKWRKNGEKMATKMGSKWR